MGDYERLLSAYLYLCALERGGEVALQAPFDIHLAWINYCRWRSQEIADNMLAAAMSQGFGL